MCQNNITAKTKIIALAGNPNVGKSTLFNHLTGMKQHTGNWPGKTVAVAEGRFETKNNQYSIIDLPGTYSLIAHSAEEEVARNFICFEPIDAVVIVCDATCLERNLNLVLQTIELTSNVILCVNLMDEAKKRKINLNLDILQKRLGVPVISTVARKKKTLQPLLSLLDQMMNAPTGKQTVTTYSCELIASSYTCERRVSINGLTSCPCSFVASSDGLTSSTDCDSLIQINYPPAIEAAIAVLAPALKKQLGNQRNTRWFSIQLLDQNASLHAEMMNRLGFDFNNNPDICTALQTAKEILLQADITPDIFHDCLAKTLVNTAETVCQEVITCESSQMKKEQTIDRILTGKKTAYPIMLLLLLGVFWLTITGANYPSQLISTGLFAVQDRLTELFLWMNAPDWLHGILVLGVYRVLAWIVSVMLPPMAIFFPLFTLLEDAGYLPRVAFNLDKAFQRCRSCGKQSLTMCMGFGCNAAGVIGCRIIDSPRERLLAILTNSFVPCNGRFPTIILLLGIFFINTDNGFLSSVLSSVYLTLLILFGIFVTFAVTRLLSSTLLKGLPSSFTLELPPYRRPQLGKVLLRSIFDRTIYVLGRAVIVAIPAGLIIWLMANIQLDGATLLYHCSTFLDPFARFMGLDGIILMAFILGFPANEIVLPIILMAYLSQGSMPELSNPIQIRQLFLENGWTVLTAINFLLFSLMHWPCSTTLLTIKKETESWKWTLLSALIPTVIGIITCTLFTFISNMLMNIL